MTILSPFQHSDSDGMVAGVGEGKPEESDAHNLSAMQSPVSQKRHWLAPKVIDDANAFPSHTL
ncbi:MAG: hypothetical protein RJAPGHWK_002426 [Candidatus Fervidibacter sp.]